MEFDTLFDLTIFLLRWLTVQICFVLPAIFAECINRLLSHLAMRQCEMFCIVETVVISIIIEIYKAFLIGLHLDYIILCW